MNTKQTYADRCFGLSVEQIRYYDELTPEQQERCHYYFGVAGVNNFLYAVKKSGELISTRERKRAEWGG